MKPIKLSFLIVSEYLLKFYCICIIWNSQHQNLFNRKFNLTSTTINNNTNGNNSELNSNTVVNMQFIWINFHTNNIVNNELIESGISSGCQVFIVSDIDAIRFLDAYNMAIYSAKVRYAENHFIFLPNHRIQNVNFDRILNHPVILDVPNVLIINGSRIPDCILGNYDLMTTRFVGQSNNTSIRFLDAFYGCNFTFKQNANLFPDKLSNLQHRSVKLALFNYKPYSIWQEVMPGHGNANAMNNTDEKTLLIDGTESLVMLEFCLKFNCTLNISLDEANEWGEIWDNKSGIGVLGGVAERKADVGISALYLWPITRTGITCIVPKPKLIIGLVLPARPFSLILWIAVFLSFIYAVIGLVITEYHQVMHKMRKIIATEHLIGKAILKVGAIYLFQSTNLLTKTQYEMIVFVCIMLISLMIGNAYIGGLASIMTIPQYEVPIDTVHQLAEKKLHWGATHDAWIFSILAATQSDIIEILRRFHAIPAEELLEETKTDNFGFSVERLPYGHFAIGEYITEDVLDRFQLMKNDIYYEYCVAVSYKTWALRPNLDKLIGNVVESGIQKWWELQVVMRFANNKVQLGVATSRAKHFEKKAPISLTISHISGAFLLWLLGIFFSFLTFLSEVFHTRKN